MKWSLRTLAEGIALTKAQQKVFNKLSTVYYEKCGKWFDKWKQETFRQIYLEIEQKKARVIDRLV